MKRVHLLAVVVAMMLCVPVSQAQLTTGYNVATSQDESLIEVRATVTGLETLTSNHFTLEQFDGESFATYPLKIGRVVTGDTCHIASRIQGSYDGETWFQVDTLAADDSTSGTWVNATFDFNNHKFPLYRVWLKGVTGARPNFVTQFRLQLYAYKRDPR